MSDAISSVTGDTPRYPKVVCPKCKRIYYLSTVVNPFTCEHCGNRIDLGEYFNGWKARCLAAEAERDEESNNALTTIAILRQERDQYKTERDAAFRTIRLMESRPDVQALIAGLEDAKAGRVHRIEDISPEFADERLNQMQRERDQYKREAHALRSALADIMGMLDDGSLVRPIDGDGDPTWGFKVLPVVMKLARAKDVLENTAQSDAMKAQQTMSEERGF